MARTPAFDPELATLLAMGAEDAQARHEWFTTLHLLQSVIRSDRVRAALASKGGSWKSIETAVNHRLDAGVENAEADAAAVEHVLESAIRGVVASGGHWLAATDVLVAIAEMTGCAGGAALAAHEVTPLMLKLHLAQAPRRPEPFSAVRRFARRIWPARIAEPAVPRPDAPVRILMHNDRFTTKEFVVKALERHFGLTPEQAGALTEQIHTTGVAILIDLPYADAIRRIDAITGEARAEGFPLRLSIDVPRGELPRAELRRR